MIKIFSIILSITSITLLVGCYQRTQTSTEEMNPQEHKNGSITFSKIEITIKLTEDGYFEKVIYDEIYKLDVKAPIIGWSNQEVKGLITEEYRYNI